LTHKSREKRERKRERRHARCTLHSDGRPARPDFDQREKSFASCALKIEEEEEEEETAPPLRAAGRSSRFWTVESTPPLPPPPSAQHRSRSLALGSLPRSVMKVLQVERAACDNKAILLFITGRLTSRARASARAAPMA